MTHFAQAIEYFMRRSPPAAIPAKAPPATRPCPRVPDEDIAEQYQLIKELLADGECQTLTVADVVGITAKQANNRLENLVKSGIVTKRIEPCKGLNGKRALWSLSKRAAP